MRRVAVVLTGLLLPLAPAGAQVTTNDGALDSLGKPSAPATRTAPAARPVTRPAAPRPANRTAPSAPAAPAGKTAKPNIPVTPPAILALPPAVAVPLAHPPPAPVVPLAADAPGEATPIANGLRVTFGADRADLNQTSVMALTEFASGLAGPANTQSINIFAYATGNPDDPSTPRRLSLERALAVRAVLMQAGIPSPRIYPRALGPASGELPDRVDVVTGSPTPPSVARAAGPAK